MDERILKSFSDLHETTISVYLGSLSYMVSIGSYKDFLLSAGGSNEVHRFFNCMAEFQNRLDRYADFLKQYYFNIHFSSERMSTLFPREIGLSGRDVEDIFFNVSSLSVTELEFVDGSVKARAKVVAKGVLLTSVVGVAANLASIYEFFAHEKALISSEASASFSDNFKNYGNINIDIDVDISVVVPPSEKVNGLSVYFLEPRTATNELQSKILNKFGVKLNKSDEQGKGL